MFSKIKEAANKFCTKIAAKKAAAEVALDNAQGEMFLDKAVWIIAIIVVGALVLALMYALIGDTVMPTVTQKVTDLFDYQG